MKTCFESMNGAVTAAFALALSLAGAGLLAAAPAEKPTEPRQVVQSLVASGGQPREATARAAAHRAYRQAMTQLGQAKSTAVATGAGQPWLQSIATNWAANPSRVEELVAEYGVWHDDGRGNPVVRRPPPVASRHLTPEYRLAWEFLLLAPPSDALQFMERGPTITKALAAIGNPESIPVLVEAYRVMTAPGVPQEPGGGALERQYQILGALAGFRSAPAVQAMLECAELSAVRQGANPPAVNGRPLTEWPARLIGGDAAHRETWRAAIRSLPRAGLTGTDQLRLGAIESALAP